jgi:hypothetical protein
MVHFAGRSQLARYAARNENFVPVVHPHNGLGARSAPNIIGTRQGPRPSGYQGQGPWLVRAMLVVAGLVALSSAADAQTISLQSPRSQVGFVGGVSIDPEQAFVGVFWQTPPIANRFHLRPGIDGGFGDGLRLATINIDFIARFPLGASGWHLIQGGGPVIVLTKIDDFEGTDLSAGGSYIIGFAHDAGFFGEFRIGGGNVPSLKMGAGWAIRF